ncbi:MAG: glutamine synthetase [candidate division NC10 bacterium]|nr:glutamine synthetase [candidate division NC10 bacterium]
MPGNLELKTLRDLIQKGEIDTVLVAFPDMQGRLMGKRVTGHYFADHVEEDGIHACAYLLTVDVDMEPLPGFRLASWNTGYQDFRAVPDLTTLRHIPWLEKTAMVLCDLVTEDGEPVDESPRRILRRQVERARAKGIVPMLASELEFYLFKDSFDSARQKGYHDLVPFGSYLEDYHILQTTKEEPVIRAIRNGMEGAGIPVEFSKGEWGAGQEEINLRYAEAVEMADRHAIYKNGVKEIAYLQGHAVTFMAKYDMKHAGSSFHLHASLWDPGEKRNLFVQPGTHPGSELFQQFLAGQLAQARAFSLWYAPYVNSYKRYQAASFAPTRIAWGVDNRTCGFRVCGHGNALRVENRMPGADANPYLAFAATIAAGLYGIEQKLSLPPMFEGNAYDSTSIPQVPRTLREAIAEFEQSKLAREAFGDNVVEHYLHAARLEQEVYDRAVTCWELMRNFERI